jgi:hypothetical protein
MRGLQGENTQNNTAGGSVIENGMQKAAEIEKSHLDGDSDNKGKQGPGTLDTVTIRNTSHHS